MFVVAIEPDRAVCEAKLAENEVAADALFATIVALLADMDVYALPLYADADANAPAAACVAVVIFVVCVLSNDAIDALKLVCTKSLADTAVWIAVATDAEFA